MTVRLSAALITAVCVALSAPIPASASSLIPRPTAKASYSAKIVVRTVARSAPGGGKVVQTLHPRAPIYGGRHSLLIMDSTRKNGRVWAKVLLSKRPNDAVGWVPADQVLVQKNPYRVVVNLATRTVSVFRSGRRVQSTRAVIGAARTPTPTGTFAVLENVPQPRGSNLGPLVIALTSHSNVHRTFEGGDGRVGIHGYERLGDRLGSAASNGCIRIPARAVKRIARVAQPGTPVIVRRR